MIGRFTLVVSALWVVSIASTVVAQTKPAVPLPGASGKVGTPYLLGKKGEELVFTLEKAEFASRALMKDTALWPSEGQRLLILTYAIQNPGNADRQFFSQSLAFTVVSPDDENFLCDGLTANGLSAYHPDRRDRLSMALKPAQKVRAITVVVIHPKGPVNKLIVQRGKGTSVLRYDLKDKVKPMTGAYADSNGIDILEVGAAKLAAPFDLGIWDMTIESVEDVPAAIGDFAPDAGKKWVVLTMSLKNAGFYPVPLHGSMITGRLFDADGAEVPMYGILKASTPEKYNGNVDAGASLKVRMLFETSLPPKAAYVILRDANSGRFVKAMLEKAGR